MIQYRMVIYSVRFHMKNRFRCLGVAPVQALRKLEVLKLDIETNSFDECTGPEKVMIPSGLHIALKMGISCADISKYL